jgi:arsenate reductase
MAEGWARSLHSQLIDTYSAGTSPHGVNPLAITVMAEAGIDISRHESKHLDTLNHLKLDLVITVCDNAASNCPVPPKGTRVVHVPFDDPPQLAKGANSEEEALQHYRRVRDEIRDFMAEMPSLLSED